jgi:hypothetical protein
MVASHVELTGARRQPLLAWNLAMFVAVRLTVSYPDNQNAPVWESTRYHGEVFTYRGPGVLASSRRGIGARSLSHGADMPGGKPWVIRMGCHRGGVLLHTDN